MSILALIMDEKEKKSPLRFQICVGCKTSSWKFGLEVAPGYGIHR